MRPWLGVRWREEAGAVLGEPEGPCHRTTSSTTYRRISRWTSDWLDRCGDGGSLLACAIEGESGRGSESASGSDSGSSSGASSEKGIKYQHSSPKHHHRRARD